MSESLWSRAFWAAAFERAVKTFAQSLAALLAADGAGLVGASWWAHLSVAGMASVLSILTSVASSGVRKGGPSLASESIGLRYAAAAVLLPLALLAGGCTQLSNLASDPDAQLLDFDAGVYRQVAPDHADYVRDDASLPADERARRLRTLEVWRVALVRNGRDVPAVSDAAEWTVPDAASGDGLGLDFGDGEGR